MESKSTEIGEMVAIEVFCLRELFNPATSTKPPKNAVKAVFYPKNALAVTLRALVIVSMGHVMPHKPCRFVNGKEPMIVFYGWDPVEGRMRRGRVRVPVNLGAHEAVRWRKRMMAAIDHVLAGGAVMSFDEAFPQWLGGPNRTQARPEVPSLVACLERATAHRALEVRSRTAETYENTKRRMIEWLKATNRAGLRPGQLDAALVAEFSDWLLRVRKVNAVTRNNYFQTLRAVFNHMVALKWITQNPFAKYRKIPQDRTARNTAMTRAQIDHITAWMVEHDKPLYIFTRMIYWSFARPVELARLQVRDADVTLGVLNFPASVTKNRRAGSVRLPCEGVEMLRQLLQGDPHPMHYLIGAYGKPVPSMVGENTFGDRHRRALKACGLDGMDITLYSWKHTGVCSAYDAGMDIWEIMERCRHSSISETERYMRDLGRWRDRDRPLSW